MTRLLKVRTAHPGRWKLLLAWAVAMMAGGAALMTVSSQGGLAVYAIGAAAMLTWIMHAAAIRAAKRGYRPRHSRDL